MIDKQSCQKQEGTDDPEMMINIYKGFSIPCIIKTHNLGSWDAQAVGCKSSLPHEAGLFAPVQQSSLQC